MKYFIFFITIFVGNCYITKPKLCINCKNFIKHNLGDEYDKCNASYIKNNDNFLITGYSNI